MLSGERVKRQDFVKLDEGRGDLGVETSGVEFGYGDQWDGDLGVVTSGVQIRVWGLVGWRFGCWDQWGGDLDMGTRECDIH